MAGAAGLNANLPKDNPRKLLNFLSHHDLTGTSEDCLINTPDASKVAWRNTPNDALDVGNGSSDESEEFSKYHEDMLLGGDSDADSGGDSDIDTLKSAGVWSDVETIKVHLSHLNKLKSAYLEEFVSLKQELKENRRRYLEEVSEEYQILPSIHSQNKDSAADQKSYSKLKALRRYRRHHGKQALLRAAQVEKRNSGSTDSCGGNKDRPKAAKHSCLYGQGSWKCGEPAVPLTKHCVKHILADPHQQLYKACGVEEGGSEPCTTPIIPLPHVTTCIYHTPVPPPHSWEPASSEVSAPTSEPPVLTLTDSASVMVMPDADANDVSAPC